MSNPKLNIKEETSAKKTRSPPKKTKVEQSVPKKKKLKTDADKAAEKAQHLRFGKAELTPDELSRLSKAQKREMYAAHAARSAAHHEVDQYEDDNVGTQALSEGEKAAGDRQILAKQLNISPHQLSYVTHSGEGEGLLFFGNVILPFVDRFPTDLELYRIMTTKLGEVSEGAQK